MTNKGVFCIEGLWEPNKLRDKSTVLPILELLEKRGICGFIYHDCATGSELEYYLRKWKTKAISDKYPILYLALHGKEECIYLNNKDTYTIENLSELLEEKCFGKIIYFGSCSTFKIDKRKINSFLIRTNAIATIGYRSDIDWIKSTACDMFVFEALQNDKFDSKGISNIYEQIKNDYGNLHNLLDLRIVINETMHFPRKRKR